MKDNLSYQSTAWTAICSAQNLPDDASVRINCLTYLAERYHAPAKAMMRQWGIKDDHKLEDSVQEYFTVFLEKNWLDQLNREKGSFRGFLRVSIRNFLLNAKARDNRRPAQVPIAEENDSEVKGIPSPESRDDSPEDAFNRSWARELMNTAVNNFYNECDSKNLSHYIEIFKRHVLSPEIYNSPSVKESSDVLGISEKDATNYLYRARKMFAAHVHSLVNETVSGESEVEKELADLRKYF